MALDQELQKTYYASEATLNFQIYLRCHNNSKILVSFGHFNFIKGKGKQTAVTQVNGYKI